jgi:NAD(P)-dependent dehydrogenase (short-subunit alcohol dehydrogenase family)
MAYADALLAAGARKVYAAARDPSSISNGKLSPVRLDVTSPKDVASVGAGCRDVNLLINNAGIMLSSPILGDGSEAALRREMEVNVYGLLSMARTFAPVLASNGGGAMVNVLSVVSWFVAPSNPTYCASKHAALAVTDGLRMYLKAQHTQVVGVYAGYIETDMAAKIDGPKTSPRQVAERTLEGIRAGEEHVYADARAEELSRLSPRSFATSGTG